MLLTPPSPLSQTVTLSRTPLERDVLYGWPLTKTLSKRAKTAGGRQCHMSHDSGVNLV